MGNFTFIVLRNCIIPYITRQSRIDYTTALCTPVTFFLADPVLSEPNDPLCYVAHMTLLAIE